MDISSEEELFAHLETELDEDCYNQNDAKIYRNHTFVGSPLYVSPEVLNNE